MKRVRSCFAALGITFALAAGTTTSHAAERWVDRPMTLHRLVFAGDVGLGVGHVSAAGNNLSRTGVGMNAEAALGVTERLELGLRTGFRFGDEARGIKADGNGRTLWTETWGTEFGSVANPELRLRWVAYSGSVAEVGLDGRLFMPIETGSNFGMMFGVPFAFHIADFMRLDTGVFVPIVFNDPAFSAFTLPGYFWFQASEKLWLGPMMSVRFVDPGVGGYDGHLLLGFGLGYQVAGAVDLKTWLLFPAVDNDITRSVGAGFGVQFRIGD